MSKTRAHEILICPVCSDALRIPVVTLPCQHNVCKECVSVLQASKFPERCPECHADIKIGNGDKLPRNTIVEKLIEEYYAEDDEPQTSETIDTFTDIPSKDLVVKFKKVTVSSPDSQSDSASHSESQGPDQTTDKPLSNDTTGEDVTTKQKRAELKVESAKVYKNMQESVEKVNTLMVLDHTEAAAKQARHLASVASGLPLIELHHDLPLGDVREMARILTSKGEPQAGLSLVYAAKELCQRIPDPEVKVNELMFCAGALQQIAVKMKELDQVQQFREEGWPILGDILRAISHEQRAERRSKVLKEAWCLRHVAMCCSHMGDNEEAAVHNKEALELLRSNFGERASFHRIYGICCHNLATANKHLGKLDEARQAYVEALEAFGQAEDWPDAERKRASLNLSSTGLSEVENLLKK